MLVIRYNPFSSSRTGRTIGLTAMLLCVFSLASGCATHRHERGPAHTVPSIWPVQDSRARVSSKYGVRNHNEHARNHTGIDIAAPKKTPVVATADGSVRFAGRNKAYGRMVKIAHAGEVETWYAHLKSCKVKAGRKVRQGQLIGRVGKTGRATGPHLHYEVRVHGRSVDPRRYLP